MTRLSRIAALLAILLITTPGQATQDEIQGVDIIDRVARVLRVSPETATTWHAGVASLEAWPARLERALLETLGPRGLRNVESGLQTLETLRDAPPADHRITEDARRTLSVIIELIDRIATVEAQRNQSDSALEQEREAHRQTMDKLNALREIDHQLDERDDNGER